MAFQIYIHKIIKPIEQTSIQ